MKTKIIIVILAALVVVAGAAIFIPKLLKGDDKQQGNSQQQVGSEQEDEDEIKPVTLEDLVGTWALDGYGALDGSTRTSTSNQYMVFTKDGMRYYINGEISTDNTYQFVDEYNILLTSKDDGSKLNWTLETIGKGRITIIDTQNGIKYFLRKVDGSELGLDMKPITAEELNGVWHVVAYSSGGVKVESGGTYMYFTNNSMYYYANSIQVTDNSYAFTDAKHIMLTSRTVAGATDKWGIYKNDEGQLVCTDSAGTSYFMEKSNLYQPDLSGTWEMYAWSLADGSSYTSVANNYLQFKNGRMAYYVSGIKGTDNSMSAVDNFNYYLTELNTGNSAKWCFISTGSGYAIATDTANYLAYYIRRVADIDFEARPQGDDISVGDLIGTWELYAWDLTSGGNYTPVSGQQIVFTDKDMRYIINGAVASDNTYKTEKGAVLLTNKGTGGTDVWTVTKKGADLIFTDSIGIMYYCRKAASSKPEDPTPEINKNQLVGTWTLKAWDLTFGGNYTEVTGREFVFTDTDMAYIVSGATITDNTYVLDGSAINLTDKTSGGTAKWELAMDGDNLVMTDNANYLVYYCQKKTDEPAPGINKEDLLGTWTMVATDSLSGDNYTLVDNQEIEFTDTDMISTVTNTSTYVLNGSELSMTNADTGVTATWTLVVEKGVLMMVDSANSLIYYCVKQEGTIEGTTVTQADLQGGWTMVAWSLSNGEYYTPVTNQEIVFTATDMLNFISASSSYALSGNTITLTDNASGVTAVWKVEIVDGKLVLTDTAGNQVYYCERTPEPVTPVISQSDLMGTWTMVAWDSTSGGMYTENTNKHEFIFTETDMTYMIDDVLTTDNTYVLHPDSLELTLKVYGIKSTWGLAMNEGTLVLTNTAGEVVYYCIKNAS